jgi:hypothetical protein
MALMVLAGGQKRGVAFLFWAALTTLACELCLFLLHFDCFFIFILSWFFFFFFCCGIDVGIDDEMTWKDLGLFIGFFGTNCIARMDNYSIALRNSCAALLIRRDISDTEMRVVFGVMVS